MFAAVFRDNVSKAVAGFANLRQTLAENFNLNAIGDLLRAEQRRSDMQFQNSVAEHEYGVHAKNGRQLMNLLFAAGRGHTMEIAVKGQFPGDQDEKVTVPRIRQITDNQTGETFLSFAPDNGGRMLIRLARGGISVGGTVIKKDQFALLYAAIKESLNGNNSVLDALLAGEPVSVPRSVTNAVTDLPAATQELYYRNSPARILARNRPEAVFERRQAAQLRSLSLSGQN